MRRRRRRRERGESALDLGAERGVLVGELFGALTDRRKSLGPSVAPMPPAIYSVEQMVDELETSGSLYCRCGKCIEQNVDFKHDLPMSETFVCVCGREYSVTTEDHLEYGIKKIK